MIIKLDLTMPSKLAKMPAQSSLNAMENRYGIDLDAQS